MSAVAVLSSAPDRVLFGIGAEAALADALGDLGARRVLLVALDRHPRGAERLARALGPRAVGVFTSPGPQVPAEVAAAATARARETGADWVVAHGGGTPIGVAKAVALALDVQVGAVPTTYSGSERTDIWGVLNGDGTKTTGRDARVRPRLVAYDPQVFAGLRFAIAGPSIVNALAHSVEALYVPGNERAGESVPLLLAALGGLHRDPADLHAVEDALRGAYLAAEALATAPMALHHKLAHVLGALGLPHAETHTVLLPHTWAYNAPAAPAARAVVGPADALWERFVALGLPSRLDACGFTAGQIPRAVRAALERPYANPAPVTEAGLTGLLTRALTGERPA